MTNAAQSGQCSVVTDWNGSRTSCCHFGWSLPSRLTVQYCVCFLLSHFAFSVILWWHHAVELARANADAYCKIVSLRLLPARSSRNVVRVARMRQQNFSTQRRHRDTSAEAWRSDESDHCPWRQTVDPIGRGQSFYHFGGQGVKLINACIQPMVANHGPSVMIWGAIHYGGRSERVVLDGTLNHQPYIRLLQDSLLPWATGVLDETLCIPRTMTRPTQHVTRLLFWHNRVQRSWIGQLGIHAWTPLSMFDQLGVWIQDKDAWMTPLQLDQNQNCSSSKKEGVGVGQVERMPRQSGSYKLVGILQNMVNPSLTPTQPEGLELPTFIYGGEGIPRVLKQYRFCPHRYIFPIRRSYQPNQSKRLIYAPLAWITTDSGNGLVSFMCQAIAWTNFDL